MQHIIHHVNIKIKTREKRERETTEIFAGERVDIVCRGETVCLTNVSVHFGG